MTDLGQYDAIKKTPTAPEAAEQVFAKHKSRTERLALAGYIADYIMEEQSRGNTTVDKFMVLEAIEAFEGGAR
jgi:hypothetical protein